MTIPKDWSGIKLEKLTYIRPTDQRRGRYVIWEALCDCGTTCYFPVYPKTPVKSCGCTKKTAAKDFTGVKLHMLTFIKPTDERRDDKVVWELLCDCGNTVYLPNTYVTSGNTQSCGCLYENNKHLHARKYDPVISSARHVWRKYANEIDFDTFYALSQQECFYCGVMPYRVYNVGSATEIANTYNSAYQREGGDFIYNGLDRMDSGKGHTVDNVVACCWECNRMKSNIPIGEFLSHIKLIYKKHFS